LILRIDFENWFWELILRIDFENWFWELILWIDFENWFWELILRIYFENWFWELILRIDFNWLFLFKIYLFTKMFWNVIFKVNITLIVDWNLRIQCWGRYWVVRWRRSGFGRLGVSVLASGTQVRGFKPGRSRRIFKGGKILSAPSFGRGVKPWVPCHKICGK
jgi:hypothetical protein